MNECIDIQGTNQTTVWKGERKHIARFFCNKTEDD